MARLFALAALAVTGVNAQADDTVIRSGGSMACVVIRVCVSRPQDEDESQAFPGLTRTTIECTRAGQTSTLRMAPT